MMDSDPREDIVVNHVHPGYVDTDMTSHKGPLTIDRWGFRFHLKAGVNNVTMYHQRGSVRSVRRAAPGQD